MTERVPICRGLLALTLLGLLLRTAFLALEPPVDRRGDEPSWIDTAFIAVHGFAESRPPLSPWSRRILFYPPLYPYFLAVSYHFTGGHSAAQWIQLGVSSLLIPAVGLIGASVFSRRTGLLAAAAIAVYPDLIWFAAHFWSETLFLTFLFWGIERALHADATQEGGTAFTSGALLGLAALTRDTGIALRRPGGRDGWPGHRRPKDSRGRTNPWCSPASRDPARGGAVDRAQLDCSSGPSFRSRPSAPSTSGWGTATALNLWVGNSELDRDEVYRLSDSVEGPVAQYRLARERALADIVHRQPGWIFEKTVKEMPRLLEVSSEAVVFTEDGAYGPDGVAWRDLVRFAVGLPWALLAVLGAAALVLLRLTRPSACSWSSSSTTWSSTSSFSATTGSTCRWCRCSFPWRAGSVSRNDPRTLGGSRPRSPLSWGLACACCPASRGRARRQACRAQRRPSPSAPASSSFILSGLPKLQPVSQRLAERRVVLFHARAKDPGLFRVDREEANALAVRRHFDLGDLDPLAGDPRERPSSIRAG